METATKEAVVGSAAAVAGSGDEEAAGCELEHGEAGWRRSGRQRISTTVRVDGYDVKRLNMYSLEARVYQNK